jgi:hypothetical protein
MNGKDGVGTDPGGGKGERRMADREDDGLGLYYLLNFSAEMKRGSVGSEGKAATKPKSNTVVASKLLKSIQDSITKQLSTGKMTISPVIKSLPKPNNMEALRLSNPEEYFSSLEDNLKAIRDSIDDQRVFYWRLSVSSARNKGRNWPRRKNSSNGCTGNARNTNRS